MFQKLVAFEKVNLEQWAFEALQNVAEEVVIYEDVPESQEEIARRIGDADAVLISYTSILPGETMRACPNLKYVGMCCSLYAPESANVDILAAEELGITVTGVRDYGDPGVVEYVLHELIGYLHGLDGVQYAERRMEIASLRYGIVGLGTTGSLIARALRSFGAQVSYFSRTRKPDLESEGLEFLPLDDLLAQCDCVFTCLNKNVVLLHEHEFECLGGGKILFNTSIAPSHDCEALKEWLDSGNGRFFCDSLGALGSPALLEHPQVVCRDYSSGSTAQAAYRLSQKVLANIHAYQDGV